MKVVLTEVVIPVTPLVGQAPREVVRQISVELRTSFRIVWWSREAEAAVTVNTLLTVEMVAIPTEKKVDWVMDRMFLRASTLLVEAARKPVVVIPVQVVMRVTLE